MCLNICGIVRDIAETEDIVQDTFVKLAVKKPRFNRKYSFKTWLYAIARNAAYNYMKRHRAWYFETLDTEEISKIMDKSKRQVGDLQYRAKKSLRSKLERAALVCSTACMFGLIFGAINSIDVGEKIKINAEWEDPQVGEAVVSVCVALVVFPKSAYKTQAVEWWISRNVSSPYDEPDFLEYATRVNYTFGCKGFNNENPRLNRNGDAGVTANDTRVLQEWDANK